ncbi:hypothetical protein [Bifidobacterium olomucense]|uniref:hypothetical protein n=1 Tax=Bifidobacterium olomucense TaxID=2675324 RepID=UPI001F0E5D1D|nr:hypothetical protein [Bifidobacterium sp. DSM 109959]
MTTAPAPTAPAPTAQTPAPAASAMPPAPTMPTPAPAVPPASPVRATTPLPSAVPPVAPAAQRTSYATSAPTTAIPAPAAAPAYQSPQQTPQQTQVMPPVAATPPSFIPAASPIAPGAAAMPAGPAAAVAIAPRKSHKKLLAAISALIAVILVAALAFIIPNFTAIKALLGFRPTNPLVVTFDAVNSLSTLRSTKFEIRTNSSTDGELDMKGSGMYSLGRTTDESSASLSFKNDSQSVSLAWYKGDIAGKSAWSWAGDKPYYIYYPSDQYEDDLKSTVGSDWADLILNVKDAVVKNGSWDIDGAEKTFYDELSKINGDEYSDDIDRAKETKPSDDVKAEAKKFSQQYFGVELENKDVRAQLFPNTTSVKSSGNTQLSYEIDVKALSQHFVNYWTAHEAEYPRLKSWIIQQIEASGTSDAEDKYRQALDDVRNWDFGTDEDVEMPTIKVDLNYGKKRLMNSISISVSGEDSYYGSYDGSLSLTLSQQNAVSVDDSDLTDLVNKAKDNNELHLS